MRALFVCVLSVSFLAALASPGRGQDAPGKEPRPKPPAIADVAARLDQVAADVEELKKVAVELPSLSQAVNDVTARVAELRRDLDELLRAGAAHGELVTRIDGLDAKIAGLSEQVGALRASVQALTAPETVVGGGGGSYADGFVLVSDPKFSLRMKGYAQLRYTGRADETLDEVLESGFLLRRARVAWDGVLYSPKLGYKIQLELGQGKTEVLDYWVEGKLPHRLALKGGQLKVPFGTQFLNPAEALLFVERSVAVEEFRYDRDLGLLGTWAAIDKRLAVSAGVFNGAGRNKPNDNIDPLLVLRVAGAPLGTMWKPEEGDPDHSPKPAVQLGAGFTFENVPARVDGVPLRNPDVDMDGTPDNVAVMQLGVDAAFRWKGVGVEAEGFLRKEDWGGIPLGQPATTMLDPDDTLVGGMLQATYFVLPGRVVAGARVSYSEVSPLLLGGRSRTGTLLGGLPGGSTGTPPGDVRTELSALVAYHRHRHGVELSAQYSFLDWGNEDTANPVGAGEQRVIVEAQVAF